MKIKLTIDQFGNKYYYLNDQLHREDGPAVEFDNGYQHWWYHGKSINCSSQQEFQRLLKFKAFW